MARDPFSAHIVPPPAPFTAPAASVTASAPAPAVEIVTALGDSVLEVDQLTQAPPRSSRARLCLAIGGGLLLAAATTFAVGVYQASNEAAARAEWQREQRPAWAFRATHSSPAADLLALGGALAGLGLCASGLLLGRRPARTAFRVGVGDGVDVALADAGRDHTLVRADGQGGFVVDLAGLSGELRGPGRVTPLADLLAAGQLELPVKVDTHVRARIGRTTFHVRGLHAAPRAIGPAPMFAERSVLSYVAGSAAVHFAILGLLATVEPDQESMSAGMDVDEVSYLSASVNAADDPPPPPPEDGDSDGGDSVPSAASSMALTDGTLGHTDGSVNPARLKVADRGLSPQMSREQAIAAASRAGVLGAVDFMGPVRTLDGYAIASGMDDIDFAGGMQAGDGDGAPVGSFGWGVSGFGAGCGTIGGKLCEGYRAGPFATIGDRPGNGTNLRFMPGFGPGPGKRTATGPKVELQKPVTCTADAPCLDEAMIRRYVRRHIEKIGYCYEKELLARPELEGTVVASFTLNGNGVVIESSARGVSSEVSGCIAEVMSNIKFPKIGDTGIYPIRYPFNLRPTGR